MISVMTTCFVISIVIAMFFPATARTLDALFLLEVLAALMLFAVTKWRILPQRTFVHVIWALLCGIGLCSTVFQRALIHAQPQGSISSVFDSIATVGTKSGAIILVVAMVLGQIGVFKAVGRMLRIGAQTGQRGGLHAPSKGSFEVATWMPGAMRGFACCLIVCFMTGLAAVGIDSWYVVGLSPLEATNWSGSVSTVYGVMMTVPLFALAKAGVAYMETALEGK